MMAEGTISPGVAGTPRILLQIEGFALFALATTGFALTGLTWWLYALLFLTPDVSFAAYGAGPRVGAVVYNAMHTTILPAALAALGLMLGSTTVLGLAAIWAAHIGFDRMLGYGLKYDTAFGHTHLGRIGRAKDA
jgi:hypothetical protein